MRTINNKLIGHLEICESELGVTFTPIVIPIMVKPKFLSISGIENFNPKKAPIEQTIVGPKRNGAGKFKGEHIHFATDKFPDWDTVLNYLM